MAEISVILPVRNAESTVEQALRSCCDQSARDLEIIVVDDASDDGTPRAVAKVAQDDDRVRVLTLSGNLGVARAFQVGFEASHGRLIARMDADDVSWPERMERQRAMLMDHPDLSGVSCLVEIRKRDVVTGTATLPPDGGYARFETWLNELIEPEAIAAQRFVDQPVVNPSMMVRRAVVEESGGYREVAWAEDYDLWLRLLHAGHRFAKVPEVLFTWSDHERRLTRNNAVYFQDQFLRCKAHYLSMLDLIKQRGVAIAGAGPIGKTLGSHLKEMGVELHRFYEVHPRRVGEVIGGVTVRGIDSWRSMDEDEPMVVLGAVGQPGKRAIIRKQAEERGFVEGETFYAVA